MRSALFLDRDGVINVDTGYVHTPQDFVFIDGIFEFCRYAREKGYIIIVVTNQSGIARGLFTDEDFHKTTAYMCEEFNRHGIEIADVFYCPSLSGPNRKPNPGMFFKAQAKWDVDMSRSVSLGDRDRDVQAGKTAGVGKNLLFTGNFNDLKREL